MLVQEPTQGVSQLSQALHLEEAGTVVKRGLHMLLQSPSAGKAITSLYFTVCPTVDSAVQALKAVKDKETKAWAAAVPKSHEGKSECCRGHST